MIIHRRSKQQDLQFLSILLVTILALTVSGCGSSGSSGGGEERTVDCPETICDPLSVEIIKNPALAVSVSVDSSGGIIQTVDTRGSVATLTIPAGAVPGPTEITVTPVSVIKGLPFSGGLVAAVQFEPEGLILPKPAILTIDLPEDVDPSELIGFSWSGLGENVHLEPMTRIRQQLTFLISHFSGAGAGEGDIDNASEAMSGATTIEGRMKNELAQIAKALESDPEICNGHCNTIEKQDKYIEALANASLDVMKRWFLGIKGFIADSPLSDGKLTIALTEYFSWEGMAIETLCGEGTFGDCAFFLEAFEKDRESVRHDLAVGYEAALSRNFEACNEAVMTNLLVDLVQQVEFEAAILSVLGLPSGAILENEVEQRYGGCQVKMDVVGFPHELTIGGDEAFFSIRLTHRKEGHPLKFLSVIIESQGSSCTRINGKAPGKFSTFTDEDGFVKKISLKASTLCSRPSDKVVVFIDVDDGTNDSDNNFILGRTFKLEADAIDGLPITIIPDKITLAAGQKFQFRSEVKNRDDTSVTWSTSQGIIDPNGLHTASNRLGSYTLQARSNDKSAPEVVATATVVVEAVQISISPPSITLSPGGAVQFLATLTGPTNTAVTWTAGGGSIDTNGNYVAGPTLGNFFVRATSVADPGAIAISAVTIQSGEVGVTEPLPPACEGPAKVQKNSGCWSCPDARHASSVHPAFQPG